MKVGIIQNLVTDDISLNIKEMKKQIEQCDADFIVLPEMWNCPYENEIMKTSISYFKESYDMLKETAKQTKKWIVGGTIAYPFKDKIYNTCFVFNDEGKEVASYDKTHLFELHANFTEYTEKEVFSPGNHFTTFDTPWAKVGIIVCYDIRFPEITRLLAKQGCEVICCPACFNYTTGTQHWEMLNRVRALENEVYFLGVGPAHYQYKNFKPYGHSMICNPNGDILVSMEEEIGHSTVDLDLKIVEYTRKKMPFWHVRRNDLYTLKEKEK